MPDLRIHDEHTWFRARLDPQALDLLDEDEERRFFDHSRACERCAAAMKAHRESAPLGGPDAHIPPHIIARWDRASRGIEGLPRRMIREHLKHCAACRQDLEALGFVPALASDPEHEATEEEPAQRDRVAEAVPTDRPQPPVLVATLPGSSARDRRRRWTLGGAAGAAAAISVALGVWRFGPALLSGRPQEPGRKAWILVAEFDGPAKDSLIVAATRDLVIAALDQSEIAATVPPDQVRLALELAGKPASTRVGGDVAREIAYRSAVRTVLEGSVGRLGKGYYVVLRLSDVDSARVALSVSGAAQDEETLIPTVSRIARRLRSELGERRGAVEATRPLVQVMTPSLEAYKAYVRASRLREAGEIRAALAPFRTALGLDPDFAAAWQSYGITLSSLGEQDSAFAAFRQALARPQRLTDRAKRILEAAVADSIGGAALLALADRMVRFDPQLPEAHDNRGVVLADAGRWTDALESWQAAARLSPFGPSQMNLIYRYSALLVLGRVEKARAIVPEIKGKLGRMAPAWIAAAAGSWSAAESLATVSRDDLPTGIELQYDARWVLAAVQALRGEARASRQTLRQVQLEAENRGDTPVARSAQWRQFMLATFSRGVAADPGDPGRTDGTVCGLAMRGLFAAASGDSGVALEQLANLQRCPPRVQRTAGFVPSLIRAWIAARGGRWQQALHDIGPAARQGEAEWAGFQNQSAPLMRWFAAEAYERLGQPDSAAAYFERAIAPPPACGSQWIHSRMAYSFGHRRLVLLYARMGRLKEARRHWEIFSETFTRPDPEMKPLIEEARAALVNAEAMASPSARVEAAGERKVAVSAPSSPRATGVLARQAAGTPVPGAARAFRRNHPSVFASPASAAPAPKSRKRPPIE